MAFLFCLLEFTSIFLVLFNTLGFITFNRKNPLSSSLEDYKLLCFTWVFFMTLSMTGDCLCGGMLGNLFHVVFVLLKLYISVPVLNGTAKMYQLIFVDNVLCSKMNLVRDFVNAKLAN